MTNHRKRSKNIAEQLHLLLVDMMSVRGTQSSQECIQELENVVYDQEEAVAEFKNRIKIENGEDQ